MARTKADKTPKPATAKRVRKRTSAAKLVTTPPAPSTAKGTAKVRKTVTLDSDVVAELERRGGSASAQLNEFARRCLDWDKRQEQILAMVVEYEAEFGEIPEADVQRWEEILS